MQLDLCNIEETSKLAQATREYSFTRAEEVTMKSYEMSLALQNKSKWMWPTTEFDMGRYDV